MKILVSDASIIIDLAKWSLIKEAFALPYEFVIPDILFEDELIDLGNFDKQQLIVLGLRIESLDSAGVSQALTYKIKQPKLTLHDCFAVTLAIQNHWALLTGDKRMRSLAETEKVEVHGVLWIMHKFAEHKIVSKYD